MIYVMAIFHHLIWRMKRTFGSDLINVLLPHFFFIMNGRLEFWNCWSLFFFVSWCRWKTSWFQRYDHGNSEMYWSSLDKRKRKRLKIAFFVGQERWLGDQNRLETDVVQAVNDSFQRIFLQGLFVLCWIANLFAFLSGV